MTPKAFVVPVRVDGRAATVSSLAQPAPGRIEENPVLSRPMFIASR